MVRSVDRQNQVLAATESKSIVEAVDASVDKKTLTARNARKESESGIADLTITLYGPDQRFSRGKNRFFSFRHKRKLILGVDQV